MTYHFYETGAIVNADGTKNRGFKKKGYHLSPLVAQPYVEDRVNGIVAQMPTDFNTWFIDCDAYGELFDDYSSSHPATQLDDMNARLARIAWIRDTHKMVVGSEGGAAYAATTIHFAHGMTVPVIWMGRSRYEDERLALLHWRILAPRRSSDPHKTGASQTELPVPLLRSTFPTPALPDCVPRFGRDDEPLALWESQI